MFHPEGPTLFELAVQALSSTDRGYDLLAPKFELTPFRTPDAVIADALTEVGSPARGLDLCCGTGAALRQLRARCTELSVGVDRSAGMLEEAGRRLEGQEGPRTELLRADALALPFDGAFDAITCFGAFGHILEADEPRFVSEVVRALAPGGRFVFVTTELPSWRSPARWAARGFNGVMRVRNALISPPFIMYYLTFLLPRCRALLEARGMDVRVRALAPPFTEGRVVVAEKPRPR